MIKRTKKSVPPAPRACQPNSLKPTVEKMATPEQIRSVRFAALMRKALAAVIPIGINASAATPSVAIPLLVIAAVTKGLARVRRAMRVTVMATMFQQGVTARVNKLQADMLAVRDRAAPVHSHLHYMARVSTWSVAQGCARIVRPSRPAT